jgi:hypothetical protein
MLNSPLNGAAGCLALVTIGCLSAQAQSAAQGSSPESTQQELERLRQRVDALERAHAANQTPAAGVDLSGEEYSSIRAASTGGAPTHAWYDSIRISGYGAFGFYDSGSAGAVPNGSFLVKEASLFVEAQPWEHVSLFSELWLTRYRFDSGSGPDIGELYAQFRDLFGSGDGARIGAKVGRIDVPFGEDYLRMDASENPLISLSAAAPWAIDEGLEVYGRLDSFSWIFAVTNGNIALGADDQASKLWCGKLSCDISPNVYVSASALTGGTSSVSTLWFGQGLITPVGAFAGSTAGTSPSSAVSSSLWEGDARLSLNDFSLGLQVGGARIDDADSTFDRTLVWIEVGPSVQLNPALSLNLRYSSIGTDASSQGYLLAGDIFGSGSEFGYDTHRMQRMTGGLRYVPNPYLQFKLEVGHDGYELMSGSGFSTADDSRTFGGIETVVSF